MLNIVNRIELACCLMNFFRNVIRFSSAYVVVVFTLERLNLVFNPLSLRFKTTRSAWLVILAICLIGCVLNMWVPFIFHINTMFIKVYCDPNPDWRSEYLILAFSYTIIVILIPILIIFISNMLIIFQTSKQNSLRKNLTHDELASRSELKKYKETKKMTRTLLIVSFSYVLLNLPYLIVWFIYYILNDDSDYLYILFKLTEIIFLCNFGIKFFLYCVSGSVFRQRLSTSLQVSTSKFNFKLNFKN